MKASGKRRWHKRAVNIYYALGLSLGLQSQTFNSLTLVHNCWKSWSGIRWNEILLLYLDVLQTLGCSSWTTFMSPCDSLLPFVFVSSAVALWNSTPVQTEGHNCRGNRTTAGAWRSKGASSHGDSCENKTEVVKCWWACQTKVEKWHIHQKAVRMTGRVGCCMWCDDGEILNAIA